MELEIRARELAYTLSGKAREADIKVAFAESCTGGLLAKLITDIPGSSSFFECGVVSYSNRIKCELLGVDRETIETYSVVSPEVAREMAMRIRIISGADLGVGITGVAGPGADGEHPEGEIYIALADDTQVFMRKLETQTENERESNRYSAAINALEMMIEYIDNR